MKLVPVWAPNELLIQNLGLKQKEKHPLNHLVGNSVPDLYLLSIFGENDAELVGIAAGIL